MAFDNEKISESGMGDGVEFDCGLELIRVVRFMASEQHFTDGVLYEPVSVTWHLSGGSFNELRDNELAVEGILADIGPGYILSTLKVALTNLGELSEVIGNTDMPVPFIRPDS